MRKITVIIFFFVAMIAVLPYAIYFYGISVIDERPVPSDHILKVDERKNYMAGEFGNGEKRLRKMTPYSATVLYFRLDEDTMIYDLSDEYPGVNLAWVAIHSYIFSHMGSEHSLNQKLVWWANSIWVTNNWSVDQLIGTVKATNLEYE